MRNQDVINASQLHVDLETEVGERLRRCLHHIFHLDTLRRHAKQSIPHTLHLR